MLFTNMNEINRSYLVAIWKFAAINLVYYNNLRWEWLYHEHRFDEKSADEHRK